MSSEVVDVETAAVTARERLRNFKSQQSTVWSRRQQAVCVRRAVKTYGTKKNPTLILDGLNMTVAKGTIYGLLGASGCGKTTLLSCIVGRRRLDSGEIWVLGGKPGSKGSGVPGPRIGYMPQEVALYGEFSIKETLIYFGWIAGMTTQDVHEKSDFIVKLLQLPNESQIVKTLSGGQQRRVSFAAALIHDPELLILDEPTVGLDPVLRQNIWDYLVKITQDGNKTVIITTHYIDETRQAHMIGLMRGGKFLAEESPTKLMAMHACDSLEDVFLKLSKQQNQGKRRRSSFMKEVMGPTVEDPNVDMNAEISGEYGDNVSISNRSFRINSIATDEDKEPIDLPPEEDLQWTCMDYFKVCAPFRMKALVWKNFLWMWRNKPVMCFITFLPVVQIILFCLSIGQDPVGLHLAVYNAELESPTDSCVVNTGCNYDMLSCRYLHTLVERNGAVIDNFGTNDAALEAVRRGRAWGALQFETNYSSNLLHRMENGRDAKAEIVDLSNMKVTMDMSNQHISLLLNRDINYAFLDFAKDLLVACNYSELNAGTPMHFNEPIYGTRVPNFTDFAAPGVILTIIFFLSVALTSGAMLIERNEGMLERMLVFGITGPEMLGSHVITQFLVMCGQTAMVLIFSFAVFGITCHGDLTAVTFLTVLTGLCGMSFGFVVSSLCDTDRTATYLAMGSFLPIVMLCGIIWPVEGMHYILKIISYMLPLTKSTESLRTILARGWSIAHPNVYIGFISTVTWIIVFMSISVAVLKFKKG